MNKIKKGEMDLQEISDLILKQVKHNQECGKDDKFTLDEIQGIIQRRVLNIFEPEKVYQKGQYYEGLGEYIGIVDTYPWGEDYFRREHCFSVDPDCGHFGKVCEINSVLIREILK